jgi:hypothetical protein
VERCDKDDIESSGIIEGREILQLLISLLASQE